MRFTRFFLFLIGIALVAVGFGQELTSVVGYIANIISLPTNQVLVLLGYSILILLISATWIERVYLKNKAIKEAEQRISEAERRVFGRVVTIRELRIVRSAGCRAPEAEIAFEEVAVSNELSEKELRYQKVIAKMEERRKSAPPTKPRKFKIQISERRTLKDRAGGVRRTS